MYKISKDDKKYLKSIIDFKQQKPDSFPFQIEHYEKDRAGHMAKALRAALAVLYVMHKEKDQPIKKTIFDGLKKLHFMDYSSRPEKGVEWSFISQVLNSISEKMSNSKNAIDASLLIAHEFMTLGVIEMSIHLGINNSNWAVSDQEVETLKELIHRNFEILLDLDEKNYIKEDEYDLFPFISELSEGIKPTFRIGNKMIVLNTSGKVPLLGTGLLYEGLELFRFTREKQTCVDEIVFIFTRFGTVLSLDGSQVLGSEGYNKLFALGTKVIQDYIDREA